MRSIAALAFVIICLLTACAPTPSEIPTGEAVETPTPTHVLPSATPTSTPLQPLNAGSSLEEIRQRMLHSSETWNTLWIQFQVLEFPLEGSDTMRRADRLQVWLQQPAEALLLLGCLGDCNPSYFLVSDGAQTLGVDLPGEEQRGEVPSSEDGSALALLLPHPVNEMIFPGVLFQRQGTYTVTGEESLGVIGEDSVVQRPVILVEFSPLPDAGITERFTIDALTGIVLSRAVIATKNGEISMDCEYTISRLMVDPQFAPGLFTLEVPAALFFQAGPGWTSTHGIETPVR
jgi:hypothetical protein